MIILAIFSKTNIEVNSCSFSIQIIHTPILSYIVVGRAQCPVACDNGACYNIFMDDESDVDLEALKNLRSSDDDADSEELLACGD